MIPACCQSICLSAFFCVKYMLYLGNFCLNSVHFIIVVVVYVNICQSLSSFKPLCLNGASYLWCLIHRHKFEERLRKGEEVLYFCFDFLQYITSQEYSLTGPLEESPDYNDTHHIEHIEINSSQQQQHEDEVEDRYMNWIPCRGEGIWRLTWFYVILTK
jgi:hypothetical protein